MRKQAETATQTPAEESFTRTTGCQNERKKLEVTTSDKHQITLTLRNHLHISTGQNIAVYTLLKSLHK